MARYTYKDIIIDPSSEEAKEAVGKECYFGDSPTYCMLNANEDTLSDILTSISIGAIHPFNSKSVNSYGCIIVKKEKSYEDRAKQWVEDNNLKVGDYVKVTRTAEDYEDGWNYVWDSRMDNFVGKILRVEEVKTYKEYIALEDSFGYPYFVLEKVKELPFKSKEEFVRRYMEARGNVESGSFEYNLLQCGMWLRIKLNGNLQQVTMINKEGIYTDNSDAIFEWEDLLDDCEFLDGSSCGKLGEELNG